jgi:ligand-binding sensor domain-containing protein
MATFGSQPGREQTVCVAAIWTISSKWDLYTVENTKGGLPNDWVYGLAEGRNGDIWLATEGGMAKFANNRWENWNHAKGLGASYDRVKKDIAFKNDPWQTVSPPCQAEGRNGPEGC